VNLDESDIAIEIHFLECGHLEWLAYTQTTPLSCHCKTCSKQVRIIAFHNTLARQVPATEPGWDSLPESWDDPPPAA
jgi:hypothetical protein